MLTNDPITQARLDLTTALRAAVRHGLNEGVCNHFSMAVPGRPDLFLVNPQGLHWSEVTPSDIVMADGDGNILEGKHPVEPTAFYIHARIHAGNPKATVVLHTHMPYVTALTSIRDGRLEMCSQNALRYWDRIAYDEAYGGVALSNDEGERMCRAMAGKEILFLRNHGVIVSGQTVAQDLREAAAAIADYLDTNVFTQNTITVGTNPTTGATITINGTLVTFIVNGGTPVGNQVALGTTAAATATALYTFLAASTDANAAFALGVPALCIGVSRGSGMHSLGERIDLDTLPTGVAQLRALLARLLLAPTNPTTAAAAA